MNYCVFAFMIISCVIMLIYASLSWWNLICDIPMTIMMIMIAYLCQTSMSKLLRMGKPLEKLGIYANYRIQKAYTILWTSAAIFALVNFLLEIPVEFVYEDGSEA